MGVRKRSRLHNVKLQGEAVSVETEAAASYPEDLAETIHAGGCTDQQLVSWKIYWKPSVGRRCHPGLS